MQFIFNDDFYKVARITGPAHNFLAIRLSHEETSIKVTILPVQSDENIRIELQEVLSQVNSGLSLVNQELGKEYYISEVQYVPSDTYTSNIYEMLTIAIIKRIDSGDVFLTT